MAGKPTALQRAQQEHERREAESSMDVRKILFTAALTLLTVSCLWWAYQLVSSLRTESQTASLVSSIHQVRDELLRDFREKESQILLAAESQGVLEAAKSRSSGALATAALNLQARLDAEWVRILLPDVEGLQPEPHPGLGYAGIYLLLKTKDSGLPTGPGGGLVRTPDAHYTWAVPITERESNNSRRLFGFLLVRYPMRLLTERLDALDVSGGYMDLRLYSQLGSGLIVASRGQQRTAAEYLTLVDVGDSEFKLAYHQPSLPLQNSWAWWANLLAFAVSAGLLVWTVRQRRALDAQPGVADEDMDKLELEDDAELEDALKSAIAAVSEKSAAVDKPVPVAGSEGVPASIFRTYDIRGIVGQTLTPEGAQLIGRAIGSEALARNQPQVVVARDGRNSAPTMAEALIEGLCRAGVDVIDIGAVPTGVLYFATHSLETGSGVMVTGSHNPPDYNGFKIVLGGETLASEAITDLHRRIVEGDLASGEGGVQEIDVLGEYVDRIASDVQVEEPLKVVVDSGNGIAGRVAPLVLEEIGCEVVPLYCDVDGDFPNHHPDPSEMDNLKDLAATVSSLDADLGVAFDGDGDRLGVVTRRGEVVFPDRLLMLFAEDVLTRNPGAAIIYDVKCTGDLARVILNHGGSPIMWKTGHSLMKGKMKEVDAALAGEMSGHFFFKERWYGFDDGIYAAARLLEILAAHPIGADAALDELPKSFSTPEIKVPLPEGEHKAFVESFAERANFDGARITTIDGIRADFDDGWGLVRSSNTTPCLVMRFDALTEEGLARIQAQFRAQLLAVRKDLDLPF